MVSEAQRGALVKLVRKCRRYFPAGSANEVWEQFRAPLDSPLEPAAFEVCKWHLSFPHHLLEPVVVQFELAIPGYSLF